MNASKEQIGALNVVLNEARLAGFELGLVGRTASVEFDVHLLPPTGAQAFEARVLLRLSGVARVSASLVDSDNGVVPLRIDRLSDVVSSFGSQPIYGWEFFDPPSTVIEEWSDRLSLDYRSSAASAGHTLHLFQEEERRSLDVCLWFDRLEVGGDATIDELIADGKRWWDAVFAGDPRTARLGIVRLRESRTDALPSTPPALASTPARR